LTFSSIVLQVLTGLASASALFLVGSGLSLIFGVTRIVNFAHGSFYMLGLYGAVQLTTIFAAGPLGWWGGVLVAALVVAAFGALIESLVLRRLYGAPELYQLLATFALVPDRRRVLAAKLVWEGRLTGAQIAAACGVCEGGPSDVAHARRRGPVRDLAVRLLGPARAVRQLHAQALAAALAHPLVDHDPFGDRGELAALAQPALLGGAAVVVQEHGDAVEGGELALHGGEVVAVADRRDRVQRDPAVLRGVVGGDHDPAHPLDGEQPVGRGVALVPEDRGEVDHVRAAVRRPPRLVDVAQVTDMDLAALAHPLRRLALVADAVLVARRRE